MACLVFHQGESGLLTFGHKVYSIPGYPTADDAPFRTLIPTNTAPPYYAAGAYTTDDHLDPSVDTAYPESGVLSAGGHSYTSYRGLRRLGSPSARFRWL